MSNLKKQYEFSVQQLTDSMMKFPWDQPEAYASFLAQTYFYTRHSTKLLTLASSRFDFDDYDLHRRFLVHAQEERGHEFMCEKDLEFLGYSISDFSECTATAAFYQRQYYLIEHVDPACFLGYVLCLEGLSAKGAGPAREKVLKHHNAKSTLFLRAHSDEDPDHIDKAFKALEPLSEKRQLHVEENLVQSAELYEQMMASAKRFALSMKKAA